MTCRASLSSAAALRAMLAEERQARSLGQRRARLEQVARRLQVKTLGGVAQAFERGSHAPWPSGAAFVVEETAHDDERQGQAADGGNQLPRFLRLALDRRRRQRGKQRDAFVLGQRLERQYAVLREFPRDRRQSRRQDVGTVGAADEERVRGVDIPGVVDHEQHPRQADARLDRLLPVLDPQQPGDLLLGHPEPRGPRAQQAEDVRLRAEACPQNAVGELAEDVAVVGESQHQRALADAEEVRESRDPVRLVRHQQFLELLQRRVTSDQSRSPQRRREERNRPLLRLSVVVVDDQLVLAALDEPLDGAADLVLELGGHQPVGGPPVLMVVVLPLPCTSPTTCPP